MHRHCEVATQAQLHLLQVIEAVHIVQHIPYVVATE